MAKARNIVGRIAGALALVGEILNEADNLRENAKREYHI